MTPGKAWCGRGEARQRARRRDGGEARRRDLRRRLEEEMAMGTGSAFLPRQLGGNIEQYS